MTGLRQSHATFLMLVVLGIGSICLVNGWRRIGKPFPGFLLAANRIVVSIGRSAWLGERAERILWAQVVAVEGAPVHNVGEIDDAIAHEEAGTPVTYRFNKQADVFSLPIEVRRFSSADFAALYLTYFCVGACFVLGGWYATRAPPPWPAATTTFFTFCQLTGLLLFLGCDVYGPHWFTPIYFTVHCLLPAALWHLTLTYPEQLLSDWPRRLAVGGSYAIAAGVAWSLNVFWDDTARFLPLIYTGYLLHANALLIYLGRVASAWKTSDDDGSRSGVHLALLGIVLSALIPGAIFVFYPSMEGTIPPGLLVGPLVFFPILTAVAVRRLKVESSTIVKPSIRRRLSLLFLAAAETSFVAGVAVSWMNSSWEQATAQMQLNYRQQLVVQELRAAPSFPAAKLAEIEATVQSDREADLLSALGIAVSRKDSPAADALLSELLGHYQSTGTVLRARVASLAPVDELFFGLLVAIGLIQAVGFLLAVRRWLMQPVAQLAVATDVIATGDLTHRVQVSSSEEFTALGNSINQMAASLSAIQSRIEGEREARHRAAATARDAERQRLGRELHDGVLQDMSAIKLQLEMMHRSSDAGSALTPVIDALITVIVGLRRMVDDIAAPELAQDSLAKAISTYSQMAVRGQEVALDLDIDRSVAIVEWATRDVYRIAQEAIGNALRHATPSRLRVALHGRNTHAILEVEDNGSGFVADAATLGAGLPGMRERAAAIGARLDIIATPARGTRVRLEIPLGDTAPRPESRLARPTATKIE